MADFVVGAVTNFIQGGGLFLNFTGVNWSAFIQDDWKATRRLTISAGLRWDPWIPSKDSLGRVACFEPGRLQSQRYPNAPPNLIYGGPNHDPGCPDAGIFADYKNFGPRFGFAYQLTEKGNTSIRGGVGYYYEPPNSLIYQQIVGVPPFAPVITLTAVSLADPYGSAGVSNPFPEEFGPRNPGPDATFPSGAISFSQLQDPHLILPMILSYNLTLEQGIGHNWLFRVAYVGNGGTPALWYRRPGKWPVAIKSGYLHSGQLHGGKYSAAADISRLWIDRTYQFGSEQLLQCPSVNR